MCCVRVEGGRTFDVPVQNLVLVHVVDAVEELLHVTLNVRLSELHAGRVEEPRKVMVHVLKHHVHAVRVASVLAGPVVALAFAYLAVLPLGRI